MNRKSLIFGNEFREFFQVEVEVEFGTLTCEVALLVKRSWLVSLHLNSRLPHQLNLAIPTNLHKVFLRLIRPIQPRPNHPRHFLLHR